MIKHVKITINREFTYPTSMLESDNLMESALKLATTELNEEVTQGFSLEQSFNVKIEKPLVYKTKEVFKNKLEQQLFDWLFEQEVWDKWGVPQISFGNLPFLYRKEEDEFILNEAAEIEIEDLTKRAKKKLNEIKKRD